MVLSSIVTIPVLRLVPPLVILTAPKSVPPFWYRKLSGSKFLVHKFVVHNIDSGNCYLGSPGDQCAVHVPGRNSSLRFRRRPSEFTSSHQPSEFTMDASGWAGVNGWFKHSMTPHGSPRCYKTGSHGPRYFFSSHQAHRRRKRR